MAALVVDERRPTGIVKRRMTDAETFLKAFQYALRKREVECEEMVVFENSRCLEFLWGFDGACVRVSIPAPSVGEYFAHYLVMTLIVSGVEHDSVKVLAEGRSETFLASCFFHAIERIIDMLDSVRMPVAKSVSKT